MGRRLIIWSILYLAIAIGLLIAGQVAYREVAAKGPWDGTFGCRPGSAYTTEECP